MAMTLLKLRTECMQVAREIFLTIRQKLHTTLNKM